MSFEGYYQKLCKNGHLTEHDVYIEVKECYKCHSEFIWKKLVDTTNDEEEPAKLKMKVQITCKHCDSILETRYHIPKVKRQRGK